MCLVRAWPRLGLTAVALGLIACGAPQAKPASPVGTASAPPLPKRAPIIKTRAVHHSAPKDVDWQVLQPWAARTAARQRDDLDCRRTIRALAQSSPDGAQSFALLLACAEADKLRDLRLAFLRPWKRYFEQLPTEEAVTFLARIIALRGGSIFEDTAYCSDHGAFLHSLNSLAPMADKSVPQYFLMRGIVEHAGRSEGQHYLHISETSASDVLKIVHVDYRRDITYFRRVRRIEGSIILTGRSIEAVNHTRLKAASNDEKVFLARADGDEIQLLKAWPVGVALADVSDRLSDRGTDAEDLTAERYTLNNGLTVILHPDRSLPLVHVNVTYRVGPMHEPKARSGFAHLFEHMMFQGSAHVARGEHMAMLESRGAPLVNAFTSMDRTFYVQTLPSHELQLALWLEADRMHTLPEGLTEASLANQKQVVRNERRERLEDAPYGAADTAILKALFAKGHPQRHGVIGASADIEAATLQDARQFFHDFYTPTNATLVVAGDFDPAQARAWIQTHFGPIPGRPVRSMPSVNGPELSRAKEISVRAPLAKHPRVSLVWPGPQLLGPGSAELELMAQLLGAQGADVLAKEMRAMGFDVRDAQVVYRQTISGTWLQAHLVLAAKNEDLPSAAQAAARIVQSYTRVALHESDLSALARSIESQTLFGLQSLQGRALLLAVYDHLFLDTQRLHWSLNRLQKVTPRGMQAAVRTFLQRDQLVVYALPKKGWVPQ